MTVVPVRDLVMVPDFSAIQKPFGGYTMTVVRVRDLVMVPDFSAYQKPFDGFTDL